MDKSFNISINLLPKQEAEVLARQRRFKRLQLYGTIIIAILFFLVSVTFGLAIIQNTRLKQAESGLDQAKNELEQFKSKEASLLVLKDRVKEISRVKSEPSKSSLMFAMISELLYPSISLSIINVDKNSNAKLVLTSANIEDLDNFLNDLLDKQKNESLVSSVTVDNFSRGKDGTYRVALKLKGG